MTGHFLPGGTESHADKSKRAVQSFAMFDYGVLWRSLRLYSVKTVVELSQNHIVFHHFVNRKWFKVHGRPHSSYE